MNKWIHVYFSIASTALSWFKSYLTDWRNSSPMQAGRHLAIQSTAAFHKAPFLVHAVSYNRRRTSLICWNDMLCSHTCTPTTSSSTTALSVLPQSTTAPKQWVQNVATRLVFELRPKEQAILLQLHWLPVCWRVQFKLCCLMHSIYRDNSPEYCRTPSAVYRFQSTSFQSSLWSALSTD